MIRKLTLTFGTSLIIVCLNIIGGILTARLLGPLGKGQLTAVTIWPGVFSAVGTLGLVEAIVYHTGKGSDSGVKTVWAGITVIAFFQTIILITLGYFLLPVLMQQYSPRLIWTARFFLLFIPLNLLTLYGTAILQGRMRIGAYNAVRLLVTGSYVAGVVVLALLHRVSVESCAVMLLASNAAILVFQVLWLNKLGWLGKKLDLSLLRRMMTYGLKAHVGNISSLLNLRMDQMIMAVILPANLLGLYVVAVTLSGGVNLTASAIATITFPAISTPKAEETQRFVFARSIRLTLWCAVLVAMAMLLVTGFLITSLFGKDFSQAVPAARILIVAAVASSMNATLAAGLKGHGRPSVSSWGELISLLFTVGLLWLLLPRWNILGAAIASLIAYSANFLFLYWHIWRQLSISPSSCLFPQTADWSYLRSSINGLKQSKYFAQYFSQ